MQVQILPRSTPFPQNNNKNNNNTNKNNNMSDNQPLSISLETSAAKTTVPLIANGQYCEFRLTDLGMVSTDKGNVTKWKFELVKPTVTNEGRPLNPGDFGATLFMDIQLYAKPDAKNPSWFVEKIAKYQDALLGTGDLGNVKGKPARPAFDAACVSQMLGKTLIAKVKIRSSEGYSDSNEFATVSFPADVSA